MSTKPYKDLNVMEIKVRLTERDFERVTAISATTGIPVAVLCRSYVLEQLQNRNAMGRASEVA